MTSVELAYCLFSEHRHLGTSFILTYDCKTIEIKSVVKAILEILLNNQKCGFLMTTSGKNFTCDKELTGVGEKCVSCLYLVVASNIIFPTSEYL